MTPARPPDQSPPIHFDSRGLGGSKQATQNSLHNLAHASPTAKTQRFQFIGGYRDAKREAEDKRAQNPVRKSTGQGLLM